MSSPNGAGCERALRSNSSVVAHGAAHDGATAKPPTNVAAHADTVTHRRTRQPRIPITHSQRYRAQAHPRDFTDSD